MNLGSKPLEYDRRQFSHSRYFGTLPIWQLPKNGLGRTPFNLNNQGFTNFCTACATSEANAFLRGKEMSFEFQAAKIGQLAGAPILGGADPRIAMKAGILFGSLQRELAPLTLEKDGAATVADYKNWPAPLDLQAGQNEDASYFQIDDGPYDAFDNISAALYDAYLERKAKGENDKQDVAMFFTQWFPQMDTTTVDFVPPKPLAGVRPLFSVIRDFFASIFPSLFGGEAWHAYICIDWRDENYLKIQNSYGNAWGDGGVQYFSRETVNALMADYRAGAFMYREVNPKDVQSWQEQQTSLQSIYAYIISLLPKT